MHDFKDFHLPDLQGRNPWEYFEKRVRSASEMKILLPLHPVEQVELEVALKNPPTPGKRGVYIHIPFCTKSCSFCGYYKCVNPDPETIKEYVDALKKQISRLAEKEWVKSAGFNALYFGGGTPTALPANLFFDLLETVHNHFPLASDCEITLESTINDLDESFLGKMTGSKINRISLGVQSFKEKVRKKYNRQSNRDQIQHKIEQIKNTGITNVCGDLMYNLEGQTSESWSEDLLRIEKYGFTGCSVYPLLPFPNAPLVKSGNYKAPDAEKEFRFFKTADDFLTSLSGWEAVTAVQYGHEKAGSAKYVELQAADSDVLALGPGAGGKINGVQYFNAFTLNEIIDDSSLPTAKTKVFRLAENFNHIQEQLAFFRKSNLPTQEFNKVFENEPDYKDFLSANSLIYASKQHTKLSQTGKYWALNLVLLLLKN